MFKNKQKMCEQLLKELDISESPHNFIENINGTYSISLEKVLLYLKEFNPTRYNLLGETEIRRVYALVDILKKYGKPVSKCCCGECKTDFKPL